MDLSGTQLTIRGHSRGSEQSCFYIPELKLHLDAGICGYYNPDYIFVTHCHSDHSFQLPMILTGLNRVGKNPPFIFAPQESKHLFQNFYIGIRIITKHIYLNARWKGKYDYCTSNEIP